MRLIVRFWWLLDVAPLMCRVAMLRLLFFGRLVRWGTAPLFAVLQAGDGHVNSWTTAVRRDLAWLRKPETSGDFYDFSDPINGDCSDWVAFVREKPAQWKTRVKRAMKRSILSPETFPVSGFPCPAGRDVGVCGVWKELSWYGWAASASVQSAWEAV